ncbi:Psmd10 [Symbiodinium sp. CCMP2592]|nr:Psmd10 [Symbiodinium sp. CCMP2592]
MLRLRALSGEQLFVVNPLEQTSSDSVLNTLRSMVAGHFGILQGRVDLHSMDESRPIGRCVVWQNSEHFLAGQDLDVLMLLRPFRSGCEDELVSAIQREDGNYVDRLLASWVDPNVDLTDYGGLRRRVRWTPLCFAAQIPGANCRIAASLLAARATFETEKTALCCACSVYNVQMAQFLVFCLADVNRRDWRMDSPLLIAASMGSRSLVQVLLRNAADVTQEDGLGRGPIERCFMDSSIEPVLSLMRARATVRPYTHNCHLLHQAAERGSHRWVACLVRARASPELRDALGHLPLDVALRRSGFRRRAQFRRCLAGLELEEDMTTRTKSRGRIAA